MRGENEVFLLLAVLTFAGVWLARVGFGDAGGARHAVGVDARHEHEAAYAYEAGGIQSGADELRVQVVRRVGKADAVEDGVDAAGGGAGVARGGEVGGEDLGIGEGAGELVAGASDDAVRDAAAVELGGDGLSDGAGGAEDGVHDFRLSGYG